MRLLLVEDDKATVESIQLCLQIFRPDCILTTIDNGVEALKTVKSGAFDGILLDLGLPYLDGLEVLEELSRFSTIPILVITARHSDLDRSKALQFGVKDFITKPFDIHYLVKSIQQHIELAPRH